MGPTGVNDLIKFDARTIDVSTPIKVHRPFWGPLFQAVAALSAPAAFFPGVGTAIWASAQGLGVMGNYMTQRSTYPRYETNANPSVPTTVYPGMGGAPGAGHTPAAFSSDPALSIITARQASLNEVPGAIGGGR